jgi:hypothetical protein
MYELKQQSKLEEMNRDIMEKIYEEVIRINNGKITEEDKFKKAFNIMLEKEKIIDYKYLYEKDYIYNDIDKELEWDFEINNYKDMNDNQYDSNKNGKIMEFINNYNLSIDKSLEIIHNYGMIKIVEKSKNIRDSLRNEEITVENEYMIMVNIILKELIKN